jgi:hypothetical protein
LFRYGSAFFVADSVETTGLKWVAPAAGGGYTLLTSGTLSSSAVNLTSISASYTDLYLVVSNYKPETDGAVLRIRFNGDTNTRYNWTNASSGGTFNSSYAELNATQDNTVAQGLITVVFRDYSNTSTWKFGVVEGISNAADTATSWNYQPLKVLYNQTGAISEINLFPSSGNFTSGNYYLYGVK